MTVHGNDVLFTCYNCASDDTIIIIVLVLFECEHIGFVLFGLDWHALELDPLAVDNLESNENENRQKKKEIIKKPSRPH